MACIKKRRGKWVVDWRDLTGRRHWETKESRDKAKDRLAEILKGNGRVVETKKTFKEYAEWWLETYAKTHVKASTYREYQDVFKNHLYPKFEHVPFTKLSRESIKRLIAEKIQGGLSRSTVRNIIAPLREMYNHAIDDSVATFNPVARIGRFNKQNGKVKKIDPLTREEVGVFLNKAQEKQPHYYPLFLCAARTGMRQGELMALTPADIDFNGRFVEVRRNISRGKVSTPKNGKTRRVDMSAQLTNVLNELISKKRATALRQEMKKPAEERRETAAVVNEVMEGWLFTTPEIVAKSKPGKPEPVPRGGTQIEPSNVRKTFNALLTAAELRRVRFHDLRHTFASILIQQGESLAYIRDQLGHHSIQITVDTYGHLVPGGNRQAVDRLDDVPSNVKNQSGSKMVAAQSERPSDNG